MNIIENSQMGTLNKGQRDKDDIGYYGVFGILDEFLKQSRANTFMCW